MRIHLLFLFAFAFAGQLAAQDQVGPSLFGQAPHQRLGHAVAMSDDGATMVVAETNATDGDDTSRVYIYTRSQGEWLRQFTLFDPLRRSLGAAVAISADGKTVVMGADAAISDELSYVSVFGQDANGRWDRVGQTIFADDASVALGCSVDVSADGRTIVVAKCFNGGYAQVYRLVGDTWTKLGSRLLESADHRRAVALSADGTRLAVGAPSANSFRGQVAVFDLSNGDWQRVGNNLPGLAAGDNFGASVDLSAAGDRLVVGIPGANTDRGAALLFAVDGGDLTVVGAALTGASAEEAFGSSVTLSDNGNVVAVGAPFANRRAGRVVVLKRLTDSWRTAAVIEGLGDELLGQANALSADGRLLLTGADNHDLTGPLRLKVGRVAVYRVGTTTAVAAPAVTERRVYPNPTRGWVQLTEDPLRQYGGTLRDISGRTVQHLPAGAAGVDMSGLAAGLYVLTWREGDEQLFARIVRR